MTDRVTNTSSAEIAVDAASLIITLAADGSTSVEIRRNGGVVWHSDAPIELEHYGNGMRNTLNAGYTSLHSDSGRIEAAAKVSIGGAEILVTDVWTASADFFLLDRVCKVLVAGTGGFAARLRFQLVQPPVSAVRVFVPGMIYGGPDHLTTAAIGGSDTWNAERPFTVLIREDRMPAPLVAAFVPNGTHLATFDAAPSGVDPSNESADTEGKTLEVDGMGLNSLGFEGSYTSSDGTFALVFCSPANEGEVTYQGTTYPGGQLKAWRRRYQTLRAGAELRSSVGLRPSAEPTFAAFASQSWRTVYKHLAPHAPWENIEQITDSLVNRLVSLVKDVPGGGRGLMNFLNYVDRTQNRPSGAILGFTGKNLESANFMLRWADDHPDAKGELARREGERIIATFLRLRVDPPEAEGFSLETGEPALAIPRHNCIYLRSYSDDMKSVARAYLREKSKGRDHTDWRAWLERFGQWLVTQQSPDGSFPRSWEPKTGNVADPSPASTYNPIPFLVHLYEITGNSRYLDTAVRSGDYCWQAGHDRFVFVGGTIDNPDVIDKEAGTLSLEAYLALYRGTQHPKWIEAAKTAANFAETWIYIWNVPICDRQDDAQLHWKKGLPTIGLQLIASGHSLVDMYMAFEVDEYARLYTLTNDPHYFDVAELLLHGTKTMISLPDRLFDAGEEGWQQEHWSVAPPRGYGLHRYWLPWVTTSHLAGIYDLKDLDGGILYRQLTSTMATRGSKT